VKKAQGEGQDQSWRVKKFVDVLGKRMAGKVGVAAVKAGGGDRTLYGLKKRELE